MSARPNSNINTSHHYMGLGAVVGVILGIVTGLIFGFAAFWIMAGIALGFGGGAAVEAAKYSPKNTSY